MNRRTIKLHKGVDNVVKFRVRNSDLKLVDVGEYTVIAKLVDPNSREKVLEKEVKVVDKGWMKMEVYEGDLVDIGPGLYELVLQQQDESEYMVPDYYSLNPFFTDEYDNVLFTVEVTAQGDTTPEPSVEIPFEDLTYHVDMTEGPAMKSWYTSAIPCNALRNHKNSNHTFALYLDNFTGKVEVFGSLDMDPPTMFREYFPIDLGNTTVLEFNQATGVEAFSFKANLMWVRIKITNDPLVHPEDQGRVDKIVWRS